MRFNIRLLLAFLAMFLASSLSPAQWQQCQGTDGLGFVCSVKVGKSIYVGGGSGVFRSVDVGVSWQRINHGISNIHVGSLAVIGNSVFAGTDGGGVFILTEGDTNWTPVNINLGNEFVYALLAKGTHLFAGTQIGVYRTIDNGQNWTAANSDLDYLIFSLAVNNDSLFAGANGFGAFVSTNEGDTWTAINAGWSGATVWSLLPLDSILFAGTNGSGIYSWTASSQTWIPSGLSGSVVRALVNSGKYVFAGKVGGPFLSTDRGTLWENVSTGIPNYVVTTTLLVVDSVLLAGTGAEGLWRRPLYEMIPSTTSLAILSPNGGETWGIGSTYDIIWRSNNVANVKIEYTTNDGGTWSTIASSIAAYPGSYSWVIPNSPSSKCKIRVSDASNLSLNDISDNTFTISGSKSISLTSPVGGETWPVGSTQNITWSSHDVDSLKIEWFCYDYTVGWITLSASVPITPAKYSWVIPNAVSSQCFVRISDAGNSSLYDICDSAFSITSGPITQPLAILSPNGGETWAIGSTHNIEWTSSNIANVKIEYSTDAGTFWRTISPSVPAIGESYPWEIPNTPSKHCEVRISDVSNPSISSISNDAFFITHTPVIIVPGIMGSSLYNSTDNFLTWDERVWVNIGLLRAEWPRDTFLDVLRLGEDGYTPYNPSYSIKVAPQYDDPNRSIAGELGGLPLKTYAGLVDSLQLDGYNLDRYDTKNMQAVDLFVFAYDWRLSCQVNGTLLKAFIAKVRDWTKADKVNIIAHSLGGLVAKSCISIQSFDKSQIDKLIFIATPHLGAPRDEYTALTGDLCLDGWLNWGYSHSEIKKISRNMSTLYQLFPSATYYNTSLNNAVSQNAELYANTLSFWDPGQPTEEKSYPETIDFFLTADGGNAFNAQLLSTALQSFQPSLMNVDYGNIRVFNTVGCGTSTIGLLEVQPSLTTLFDRYGFKALRTLNGDGTVPLRSAEMVGTSRRKADYYVYNVTHLDLPSSLQVRKIVDSLLQVPSVTTVQDEMIATVPPADYALADKKQVTASCPVLLEAFDSSGNRTGPLSDSTWEANIPGSEYHAESLVDTGSVKTLVLPLSTLCRIVVHSLDSSSAFTLTMDEIVSGRDTKTLVYESVPIRENTSATCTLRTVSAGLPLWVDNRGTGTYDSVVTPTWFVVTDVNQSENTHSRPSEFSLSQNYPNPFNPTTTIRYGLPNRSHATLTVYNTLGQQVARVVDGDMEAGYHEVKFDGSGLASGVYLYRLKAGNFIQARKLLLLK
jgi:hypothetical protein